jgi:hypothetical protein
MRTSVQRSKFVDKFLISNFFHLLYAKVLGLDEAIDRLERVTSDLREYVYPETAAPQSESSMLQIKANEQKKERKSMSMDYRETPAPQSGVLEIKGKNEENTDMKKKGKHLGREERYYLAE